MSLRPFTPLFCVLILFACKSTPAEEACALPKGRFVNRTVLDACPDKMPAEVPHYALDIEFIGADSVMIDNGFERYPLKVNAVGGCVFKIASATQFGDMEFKITSDSTMELLDSAWTQVASVSRFTRTTSGEQAEWSFQEFLNDCALTGEYTLFHNGELVPGVVTILPNGQMNGMKPFIGYRFCYAGDCLEETDPPSRTIDLIDNEGKIQTFSLKPLSGKIGLEFYSIADPVPDIKGSRAIGPMVYELRTE